MKRIRYFDLMRIASFCMIVFYHIIVQIENEGVCPQLHISFLYTSINMHIAKIAVAVFFMLSGASLMLKADKKLNLKDYYIKRFIRLLIPFYVVNILYFMVRVVKSRTVLGLFAGGLDPLKFLLGIVGIDGWLSIYNISSYYQGIGEWFLGALIIITVLAPFFRMCILKFPKLFFGILCVIYFYFVIMNVSRIPVHLNIVLKGCEFIFGMYLGRYVNKIDKRWAFIGIPILVLYFVSPVVLPIKEAFSITITAVCFFVSFSLFETILQNQDGIYKWILSISNASYELFLIHHIIIYKLTPVIRGHGENMVFVFGIVMAEIICMVIGTIVVKHLDDFISKYAKKWLLPSKVI